ncbi:unnamed protein product [Calypogeia fissa]
MGGRLLLTFFTIDPQILLLLLLTTFCGQGADAMPVPYNYDPTSPYGPEHWGTLLPQWQLCSNGNEQSPIAIDIPHTAINQSLGSLQYMYNNTSDGVLVNTGHTIQVNFAAGAGSLVLGSDSYNLKQLHFHTPSEHVINNVRFPLEMHMVHQTSDGQKLAVIGVVFWKSCGGHFLDQFWGSLPDVTTNGASVPIGPLSFEKLHIGPTYAQYPGSLTTPPCTQNVSWTVELSQWNTVSKSQLDAFTSIITEPNARPLQQNIGIVELY